MPPKKPAPKRSSPTNTKKELLDAYKEVNETFQQSQPTEIRLEERIEEKRAQQAIQTAESLSTTEIVKNIGQLKSDLTRLLNDLSDHLETEVGKYRQVQQAIAARDRELQEIFEIQRQASSLGALIEAQYQQRSEFELEIAGEKERLQGEIEEGRNAWEKESKLRESENTERETQEKKRRDREKEEYLYGFNREKQLAKDKFLDEKAKMERELQLKKEQIEADCAEREKAIAAKESEVNELQKRVSAFPKELESATAKAVQAAVDQVRQDAKTNEELMLKEFTGEKNVLLARIESLETKVRELIELNARLTHISEKAAGQIQDIAVKAIEGSSNFKSFTSLQQFLSDQTRKSSAEK